MKYFYGLYRLLGWAAENPEDAGSIIGIIIGLVVLAMICALIAAIPTIIAKTFFEKDDEQCTNIFWGSFAVLVILTILSGC